MRKREKKRGENNTKSRNRIHQIDKEYQQRGKSTKEILDTTKAH